MRHHQSLVAEDGDTSNRVHALRVQEARVFWQVVNIYLVVADERVLEGNIHGAVGVFNVEDHGIAAGFTPALDNLDTTITSGHEASQVNGTDFEILGNWNGLLGNGSVQNSGDGQLLSRF